MDTEESRRRRTSPRAHERGPSMGSNWMTPSDEVMSGWRSVQRIGLASSLERDSKSGPFRLRAMLSLLQVVSIVCIVGLSEGNSAAHPALIRINRISTGSLPRGHQDGERGGRGTAVNQPVGKPDPGENLIPSGGDYVLGSTDLI